MYPCRSAVSSVEEEASVTRQDERNSGRFGSQSCRGHRQRAIFEGRVVLQIGSTAAVQGEVVSNPTAQFCALFIDPSGQLLDVEGGSFLFKPDQIVESVIVLLQLVGQQGRQCHHGDCGTPQLRMGQNFQAVVMK